MNFWNELTKPYEERQKEERKSVEKALRDMDINTELEEKGLNLKDWDF